MHVAAAASVLFSNRTHQAYYKNLNVIVLSKVQLQHSTFKQKMPSVVYDNYVQKKGNWGGLIKM